MNREMLVKCQGHIVRLRPMARRFARHHELEPIDDDWRISRVEPTRKVVEIHNQRCDHCPSLGFDHIHSYVENTLALELRDKKVQHTALKFGAFELETLVEGGLRAGVSEGEERECVAFAAVRHELGPREPVDVAVASRHRADGLHVGAGRVHRERGHPDQARTYLARALEIFDRLGTLMEPDRLKAELAVLPPAGQASPSLGDQAHLSSCDPAMRTATSK